MRLSDLLGAEVVDRDSRQVGFVRDVRLVQDGPLQGTFGAGLRIEGLIVGGAAVGTRLGYGRRGMRAPWMVASAVSPLDRTCWYVPWASVVEATGRRAQLDRSIDELDRPADLRAHP
jgi:hypothetical protein